MGQKNWIVEIGFCVLLALIIFGCASTPTCKSQDVPSWLTSTPHDDTYFYAVGISGRTRNVNNAWIQAGNRGRAELGRIIFSHVSSKDMIISTSRGQYSSQLIDILSDTELNYTEIIERWYDPCGDYGPPNYYYVLLRMNKKTAATVLKNLQ
jgi:LPP20 lipoprotein